MHGNMRSATGAEPADVSGSSTMSTESMNAYQHCDLALQLLAMRVMTAVPAVAVSFNMQAEVREEQLANIYM